MVKLSETSLNSDDITTPVVTYFEISNRYFPRFSIQVFSLLHIHRLQSYTIIFIQQNKLQKSDLTDISLSGHPLYYQSSSEPSSTLEPPLGPGVWPPVSGVVCSLSTETLSKSSSSSITSNSALGTIYIFFFMTITSLSFYR